MAKFFTNMNLGIEVVTTPYMYVAVGNELGNHVRVACGRQVPPKLVVRKVDGMQFERSYIDRGSFTRVMPKKSEGSRPAKDRVLLVEERDNDREKAIALIQLSSGYNGDAVVSVHDRAQVIADCFTGHGVHEDLGVSHHVLAYMAPGGELRGRMSGHRVKDTCARWIFDGEEILYVEGGEDIFYGTDLLATHLAAVDQP